MTPEDRRKLNELYAFMESLKRADRIPLSVEKALTYRMKLDRFALDADVPDALAAAPAAGVSAPAGGATIDSQARSAINSLIDRLQTLGLIS